jgi:shikimate kinase
MPGVGKSSVGVVLAKALGYHFVDSDLVIQQTEGRLLSEIIEEKGNDGFIEVENNINSKIDVKRTVLATGGSAVYGTDAMEHFRNIGTILYMKASFETIDSRLSKTSRPASRAIRCAPRPGLPSRVLGARSLG